MNEQLSFGGIGSGPTRPWDEPPNQNRNEAMTEETAIDLMTQMRRDLLREMFQAGELQTLFKDKGVPVDAVVQQQLRLIFRGAGRQSVASLGHEQGHRSVPLGIEEQDRAIVDCSGRQKRGRRLEEPAKPVRASCRSDPRRGLPAWPG